MKVMMVSVRFAVEVEIPHTHSYESDEAYACAHAEARVRDLDSYDEPVAVEVVDWHETEH